MYKGTPLKIKLALFCASGKKGIKGLICVVAFHQKGQKCTFRVSKLHIVVVLE